MRAGAGRGEYDCLDIVAEERLGTPVEGQCGCDTVRAQEGGAQTCKIDGSLT